MFRTYRVHRDRQIQTDSAENNTPSLWLQVVKKRTSCGAKHNQPRPRVVHRGIVQFLGIHQKCNQAVPWSLHNFPKNFMQSVQPFSRNLANKETNKDTYKQRNQSKTIPHPRCIGDGVIKLNTGHLHIKVNSRERLWQWSRVRLYAGIGLRGKSKSTNTATEVHTGSRHTSRHAALQLPVQWRSSVSRFTPNNTGTV